MKQGMDFLKAINDLDDDILMEAEPEKQKKHLFRYAIPAVLAACVIVFCAAVLPRIRLGMGSEDSYSMSMAGVPEREYSSLSEAEEAAGMDLAAPEEIAGQKQTDWLVYEDGILEIDYGTEFILRKGTGSEEISGDSSDYAFVQTENGITLKGENEDWVRLAVWAEDGYAYSLSSASGLKKTDILAVIETVK